MLSRGGLWLDASNKSFYAYGGEPSTTVSNPPQPNTLRQFSPSGNAGSWSQVSIIEQAAISTSIVRTVAGAYASGNGLGFSLGGTEADPDSGVNVPGLIVYNSSSQLWYNYTAFNNNVGTYKGGAAHFVPSFGPKGLMFVISGAIPGANPQLLSTMSINIYEPVSNQWRTVPVTGSAPYGCYSPCLAGAAGENGTYEVGITSCSCRMLTKDVCLDFHVQWQRLGRMGYVARCRCGICPVSSSIPLAASNVQAPVCAHRTYLQCDQQADDSRRGPSDDSTNY